MYILIYLEKQLQEIIDSADDKKYQLWNELKTLVNHHIKLNNLVTIILSSKHVTLF